MIAFIGSYALSLKLADVGLNLSHPDPQSSKWQSPQQLRKGKSSPKPESPQGLSKPGFTDTENITQQIHSELKNKDTNMQSTHYVTHQIQPNGSSLYNKSYIYKIQSTYIYNKKLDELRNKKFTACTTQHEEKDRK